MYGFPGPLLVDPPQEKIVSSSILLSGGGAVGEGVGGIVTVKCEYSTYHSSLFGSNNES